MNKNLKILLDAAHGSNIPGKRSPDGLHIEYIWSRNIIKQLIPLLKEQGYEVVDLIPEMIDPKDHLKRIDKNTTQPRTLLISFHNNAAGMGDKWYNARGYSIWTSRGQTNSDKFAEILWNRFRRQFPTMPNRSDVKDGDHDFEEGFNVLVRKPMAVLIEWLFQDCKEDVKLLKDDNVNTLFCKCVIDAINEFDETYNEQSN